MIPTTYLREKLDAIDRAVSGLAEADTVKVQRLYLTLIITNATAIDAEASKLITTITSKELRNA